MELLGTRPFRVGAGCDIRLGGFRGHHKRRSGIHAAHIGRPLVADGHYVGRHSAHALRAVRRQRRGLYQDPEMVGVVMKHDTPVAAFSQNV